MNQYEDPYGPVGSEEHDNPYRSSEAEHLGVSAKESETNQWAMMLHLSQYAGYVVPLAGFLAPVLIWLLKKDDLPGLDAHGRNVVNWMISSFLYAIIFGILCVVLIGIPLAIILGILLVIFPIIGAIKASDGVAWKYPGTISIL